MATVIMNAIGVEKTITLPDTSLPEWAEAYGIPAEDSDGNGLTNQERVELLFQSLVRRMSDRVIRYRRKKADINADDIITIT